MKHTKEDLMKRHKMEKHMIQVLYLDDEPLGQAINETKKILNCSRSSLVSQALIHYCVFIQEKFLNRKGKKE